MSNPTSLNITKADAITFVKDNPLLPRRALQFLSDYFADDTRSPEEADTYGRAVSFKIAERMGVVQPEAVMVCDYLWMCRLVDRFTLIGYYMYMILPAGQEVLEDGGDIEFLFDLNIFPLHAYDEVLRYQQANHQVFEMLHAGGVKWGTLEYWDRYWKWKKGKDSEDQGRKRVRFPGGM